MGDIFDIVNEIPVLTPEGLMIPQFKKLKKDHQAGDFDKAIMYLYHVYCRKSTYFDMLLTDKRQLVAKDQLRMKTGEWKKIEEMDGVKECIEILGKVCYTANEKLFYGIADKVDEYLNFWQALEITEKNHNIVAESVKNAAMLVKLRDDLEKQIFKKDEEDTGFGGAKKTRYE